jgi:hypothetical protein
MQGIKIINAIFVYQHAHRIGGLVNTEYAAGKQVLFLGMVTGESKQELLSRADLFCLP